MADAPAGGRERLLVFVHIPKTAGTTLTTILNMNEPGARSRSLGNVFKGGGGVDQGLIARLRKGHGKSLTGAALVRGHLPLGVREYLPKVLPKEPELHCFTFLREPADRTLSHYFQVLESTAHDRSEGRERPKQRSLGLSLLPPDPTLEDVLERGYLHDNLQTRMLCGLPEPFEEVTEEMLERAKRNLRDELAFFGLAERFDESVVLAKRRLGLGPILYRSNRRVNATRPRGDDVPAGLREAAERHNRYDIELYRYASEIFEEIPERGQLEFEVELAALRAAKVDGEIDPAAIPVPAGFDGGGRAWRMLLEAKATSQRAEWERARHRIPRVAATVQQEVRETELKAARTRARKLEKEVERLGEDSAKAKGLEKEVERLRADSARTRAAAQEMERLRAGSARAEALATEVGHLREAAAEAKSLEQEVERLREAAARAKSLEQEVERLREASARAKSLEKEVDGLRLRSARFEELQEEVERLRDADGAGPSVGVKRAGSKRRRARSKDDAKASPKGGRARPRRASKRRGAKRREAPAAAAGQDSGGEDG